MEKNKIFKKSRLFLFSLLISAVFIFPTIVVNALGNPTFNTNPTGYTNGNVTVNVSVSKANNENWKGVRWVPGNISSASNAWSNDNAVSLSNLDTSTDTATGNFIVNANGDYTVVAYSTKNYTNNYKKVLVTVSNIDRTAPTITLAQSPAAQTTATVTANVSDPISGVAVIKYLAGTHGISDFASSATDITATRSFVVDENGDYTVYAEDNAGNEAVRVISVNSIKCELSYTDGEFIESNGNDGSISTELNVTLSSGKFAAGSTFALNDQYQLSKPIPAGLSFVITRLNDTALRLSFTGKATNHEAVNSVLTSITFTDNAFSNELRPAASNVSNLQHSLTIRFFDSPKITVEKGAFTESSLNDGSIAGSRTLVLTGAKLTTTGITNSIMVNNTHYRISGVPAGLTAVVTRESDTRIKLKLNGNATNHTSANSISNLNLTLLPAAFDTSLTVLNNENIFSVKFIDKQKIRVLEVYPSTMFGSGSARDGDFNDAHTSLPTADYDVTSMSMNKFISLVDDVNGNYDVVYFGRGIYSPGGPQDAYYGNDITNLAASKVKELIDGGLLCVFHSDSLLNKMTDMTNAQTKMYINFNPYILANNTNPKPYPNVVKITGTEYTQLAAIISTNLANTAVNRRPALSVYEKPFSYNDLSLPLDNNILEFTYVSSDVEDPTLEAKLYLDRNNDGLFQTTEVAETHTVNKGKGDTFYYTMPTGLTGVYFWKLVVTDSKGAKNEIEDVFYLKGDPITVNVLQVYPPNNNLDLSLKLSNAITAQPADSLGYKYGEYKANVTMVSIDDFNKTPDPNNDPKFLGSLNGHYNMIIFGFYDNYDSKDLSANAAQRVQSFINTKQSVMFTHDMIADGGGMPTTASYFKAAVGQTGITSAPQIARYAVNNWNFSDTKFVGYNMNNGLNISNNTAMGGYSLYLPDGPDGVSTLSSHFPAYRDVTTVKKVNSTAVTLYPFNIELTPQNSMLVAKTHNQYYKLNLEDPDLIPIFNLYREGAGERFNDDAMNNYYTYTKGNITYSGTGHVKATQQMANYPDFELQLFVNTMLKAYASSNHAPTLDVEKPTPNTKLDKGMTTFRLSFIAKDFDEGDETLYYKIFKDDNNNGNYIQVGAETPFARGTRVELDIVKGFNDIRAFKYKVEVRDSKFAKTEEIIPLYNTDTPRVEPSILVADSCFVNETISWRTQLTPSTTKVIPDMQIDPTLEMIVPAEMDYLGNSAGCTITNSSFDPFQFTQTGPTTAPVTTAPIILTAPSAPGSFILKAKTNYMIDGVPVNPQPSDQKSITVLQGQVEVQVVDTHANPMVGVSILDHAATTGAITDIGGQKLLVPVSRGAHEYSINIPSGYRLEKVEVKQKSEPEANYTSGSAITISTAAYAWQVKFTVKLAIEIPITYYQVLPNNDVSFIGYDDGKGITSNTYDLKTKRGSKVRIAALIDIPVITGNNITEAAIELTTTDKDGNPVTDTQYIASIAGPATAWPFATNTSAAALRTEALRPPNSTRMLDTNVTPPSGGTYAGQKYYVIIEIPKADTQKFWLSKITLKMSNNSQEEVYNSRVSLINIKELVIPKLQ